jgi:hypothetical protein
MIFLFININSSWFIWLYIDTHWNFFNFKNTLRKLVDIVFFFKKNLIRSKTVKYLAYVLRDKAAIINTTHYLCSHRSVTTWPKVLWSTGVRHHLRLVIILSIGKRQSFFTRVCFKSAVFFYTCLLLLVLHCVSLLAFFFLFIIFF